jgi:hypothetical protein
MNVTGKLASAFVLGAALSAALLKARPTSHSLLVRVPSDKPANEGARPEIGCLIPGSVLKPLNTQVLIERSVEAFPAGYLLLISIIQSVALGILLNSAVIDTSHSPPVLSSIAVMSKTVTLLGFLVVISYEYLWFIGMMRWASTFRDALIPYAIGVAEIVPCLMLNQSLSWWIATTLIPIVSAGALFNTISRLDSRAFPGEHDVSGILRLLAWRTIMCCGLIAGIGTVGSALIALGALHGIALSLAPMAIGIPALMAVGISEKALNHIFKTYGISRKPPLSIRPLGSAVFSGSPT